MGKACDTMKGAAQGVTYWFFPERIGGIMIKKSLMVSSVLLCFLLAAGLVWAEEPKTNEPKAKIEPYVAAFAYTPPAEKAPNSQGVAVAVAKASLFSSRVINASELWSYQLKVIGMADPSTGEMMWFAFPQFYNLAGSLRKDVAEILFAKGFKVRGPYDSYDAIPAADKKNIDLYFIPKLELTFTMNYRTKRAFEGTDTDIEVNGTFTLEVQNMATRESLLRRTVPLERIAFTSHMQPEYYVNDRFNSIMNEVAKGIERQYPILMNNVSGSIDPQELRSLKKSSAAGKTGY